VVISYHLLKEVLMMKLLTSHPAIVLPAKFLARIGMAALWGILLSPFDQDVKVAVGAVLAVLVLFLTPFFVGWDRKPLDAARVALYGLLMSGEAMAVGAMVMAAYATLTGTTHGAALVLLAFGGSVLPLYTHFTMYRDNMSERRD
jgi:hypothetical protein